MDNASGRQIRKPEPVRHQILGLGRPAATFHRESNLRIVFLSGKPRSCEDWLSNACASDVTDQEVHWKVVLQSSALYQSL